MTGPITFVPLTHDMLPEPCDGPTAFKEIADGAASNFSQFNAYAKASSTRMSVVTGSQPAIASFNGNSGGDGRFIAHPTFAPQTIILPAQLDFGLLIIQAQAAAGDGTSPSPFTAFKVDATGPGLGAALPAYDGYFQLSARGYRNLHQGSRWWAFPPGKLVPGASLTFRPWVAYLNSVGGYTVGTEWTLITWSGGAP